MTLRLYAHPFSSYCQKVLIALYENGTAFEYRTLATDQPEVADQLAALWPIKRIPLLVDDGEVVVEATIIIEHLDICHPGAVRFVPVDRRAALAIRMLDRFFDNYVMTPMQKMVFDAMRSAEERDARGVADARALLATAYEWLERHLGDREWVAGDFSLADCAAAPSLFYADWVQPIPDACPNVRAYLRRLRDRPSFARAIEEARPSRGLFPLGAPDRD
jgi:glutathione S-transferase